MEGWKKLYASVILQQDGKKRQQTTPPEAHGPACLVVGVCCGKQEKGLCSNHMAGDLWPVLTCTLARTHTYLFFKKYFSKRVFPCAVKFRGPRRMCTVPVLKTRPSWPTQAYRTPSLRELLLCLCPAQHPAHCLLAFCTLASLTAGWIHCSSACRAALWFW